MANCWGIPRIGFNHEKSGNPRGRGKPDKVIDPNKDSIEGPRRTNKGDLYVNSFIGRDLDHDAFRAEVDEIRAAKLAGITTKERVMI